MVFAHIFSDSWLYQAHSIHTNMVSITTCLYVYHLATIEFMPEVVAVAPHRHNTMLRGTFLGANPPFPLDNHCKTLKSPQTCVKYAKPVIFMHPCLCPILSWLGTTLATLYNQNHYSSLSSEIWLLQHNDHQQNPKSSFTHSFVLQFLTVHFCVLWHQQEMHHKLIYGMFQCYKYKATTRQVSM